MATGDFTALQRALTGGGEEFRWPENRHGPPPPDRDKWGQPCGVAALTRLRDIVRAERDALQALEAEYASRPEIAAQLAQERARAQASSYSEQADRQYRAAQTRRALNVTLE
jgi:hypothetical protein